MNHKTRPYKGYALIDRACGWAAATVFALTVFACSAVIVTDARQDAAPCDNPATEVVAETERPLLPVEYITLTVETVEEAEPEARVELTDEEHELIAAIVWLEARGECADGQQAVVEVILNRVAIAGFPDSVESVIRQTKPTLQFSVLPYIHTATPTETQYAAIDAALYGEQILPENVVYFSGAAQNRRVWGTIGAHVFCEI